MDKKENLLVNRIKKGDEEAFRELYQQYYTVLCMHAHSVINDVTVSEDIVQEVFFSLWLKRKSLIIEQKLSTYLYRTVYYQCIKYLRRKSLELKFAAEKKYQLREAEMLYKHGDLPYAHINQHELKNQINNTIQELSEKTKEIFILSRKHELKNHEIAEKLNISIKTVEYHIAKALVKLREKLKNG